MKPSLGASFALALADDLEREALAHAATTDLERWRQDPVLFAREALGVELWSRQAEFVRAVVDHERTAVRSGHKIGKSIGVAVLAIWWCYCEIGDRVILTSTTGHQIRNILWREVRSLCDKARRFGRVQLPTPAQMPANGMKWDDGREIIGFSTDAQEGFAGISGVNMLFVVDEASGVPEWAHTVIRGNLAGGGRLIQISNPTQTSGSFYDAFHTDAARWHRVTVSSEETPNVVEGRMVVPGLATRAWVEDWAALGRESPSYRVRVRGEFPTGGDNTVIPLDLWARAVERWHATETDMKARLQIGVDPARFGDDDSVAVLRRGRRVMGLQPWNGLDGPQLAGRVIELVRSHRRPGEKPPIVKVDVIGVGASAYDSLRRFADCADPEIVLVEVNVSEASEVATDDGKLLYAKLRDELWFGARAFLESGGAVPPDAQLETECVSAKYSFDTEARYKVESKDEMKKRLKGNRSPDRADGLCLCVFEAPRVEMGASSVQHDSRWGGYGGERGFG